MFNPYKEFGIILPANPLKTVSEKEARKAVAEAWRERGEIYPVTDTDVWEYRAAFGGEVPEGAVMMYDPPVKRPGRSGRTLVVGTKKDVRLLERIIDYIKRTGGYEFGEVEDDIPMFSADIDGLVGCVREGLDAGGRINFSSEATYFWNNFFGDWEYLDMPNPTVPRAIISTGNIRDRRNGTGMTITVAPRIEEIGQKWGVPIQKAR